MLPRRSPILKMSEDTKVDAERDESLYERDDDAIISARAESGVSSSMKEKLKNELRAQGADANSAFNPYPVIFIGVAVLVVVGGAGFFY
mmetsp:Transcript_3425/g.3917  ORF Transcript_3425/g.3917 Transcript_3425/m.3917 type:complete len:89 (+) Transcript_3425:159-425(+)